MKKLFALLFGAAATATFASGIVMPVRGEPSRDFNSLVGPELREQLRMALVEMAFGDPNRARAHASIAALPERLSVYLDTRTVGGFRGEEMAAWARESLGLWNDAGSTHFQETFNRAEADIVVEFKDTIRGRQGVYAGYNSTRRTARYGSFGVKTSLSAYVEISNRAPGGGLTTKEQVCKAVAHEFGHVLGLEDSGDSSDLMGPVPVRGASAVLDPRSRRALNELDSRARAIMNSAPKAVEDTAPKIFHFAEPR